MALRSGHYVQSDLEIGKDAEALSRLAETPSQPLPLRTQFELGLLLAQHTHFEQATPLFQALHAKFPGSYDAGFDLAVCYVEIKQYAEAITVLTELRTSGRKTAELDNLLAEAYKGADQVQPAIDALREATQLAPEDEDNHIDLVTLCIEEILGIGLHYRPQSDRLIFQRGILHAMKNQFDLADQDFQLASQLAPEKNLSYAGLSVSYMHTGNLPEAIASLRQRVKVKPEDSLLQYLLGETLIRSGRTRGSQLLPKPKVPLHGP
jgi:tetratricopeptide (TPR) repeat protein